MQGFGFISAAFFCTVEGRSRRSLRSCSWCLWHVRLALNPLCEERAGGRFSAMSVLSVLKQADVMPAKV